MAPSDGLPFDRQKSSAGLRWVLATFTRLAILILLQSSKTDEAAIAKTTYFMDLQADCYNIGFLDVPRNQVTYARVYATSSRSNALSCILQFSPKESGDTLRMWFERDAFVGDCSVSLTMTMTDNDQFVLGCRSGMKPPEMEAVDGRGTLKFSRTNLGSTGYGFTIGIQARRSVDPEEPGDSSPSDIAMIVGIVAAAVVAIVLLLVLCVCCYRNKKHNTDFKLQQGGATTTTSTTNPAFENGKMNPDYVRGSGGSPSSEKRLLSKNNSHDYDVEIEDPGAKPKSALERFGPTPARRSDRSNDHNKSGNARRDDDFDDSDDPRRGPALNTLRDDLKKSLGGRGNDRVNSSESSTSYNSNGVPLPPKLPPVPRSPQRSPSPQRKGEKIAGIFRARPSSSSSEIAKQLEGDQTDNGDEFVPSPRRDDKPDTRHVLRPNRGERRPTLAEERRRKKEEVENESEEEDRRGRNRERYRRDEDRQRKEEEAERERRRREEERERQRRMEEEEEDREEEEKRRKKKEREREKRRQEEEEEEEERERERERKEKRRREKERDKEEDRLEGRFKKSASGRKSKGKGPRMGRSKSTSNALEEMDAQYQRSRSKSPSSVRSLNFIEDDDDDDLDSSYMPFKRAGSKTSLYASRSSLYGRRRKNSMGETISLSSYAVNDDMDSRFGDFDRRGLSMSRRDKDKMFKSTGELEMHGATAQVVRECATQTDSSKAVYVYGRKTLAKSRPGKMYSRGCQTGRTRRDSTGSARSGRSSRMKKSRSMESLKKRSRSRNLDESFDSSDDRQSHKSRSRRNLDESFDSESNRSRRHRSRSKNLDYSDDDEGRSHRKKKHHRSKSRGLEDDDDYDNRSSRGKPRARPRKSTGAASVDLSDSDEGRSIAASSVAPSTYIPPQLTNPYGAQYVPVMFPPPVAGMPYQPVAPGGPPMVPGMVPGAGGPPPPIGLKPPIAPKPKKSKWDELVEITDKEKGRPRNNYRPDSPTESMLTSVYSHPPANGAHQQNYYAPPSYTTAQNYPLQHQHQYPDPNNSTISSAYPDSSGMVLSGRGGGHHRQRGYTPSESEI